jgi:hypothetical protein
MSDVPEDHREELEKIAKERMAEMPGETALGNRDPQAGGEGDPQWFEGNSEVPLPE